MLSIPLPSFLSHADFSRYPSDEALVSRKILLRQLLGVCERLNSLSKGSLPLHVMQGEFRVETSQKLEVEVVNLWLVGDLARGASAARRLELLVEYRCENWTAIDADQLVSKFIGAEPNLLVHVGRPELNSTGKYISVANRVWGRDVSSSQEEVSKLVGNNALGPVHTASKLIPLADDQLKLSWLKCESFNAKVRAGVLKSSFIPIHQVEAVFRDSCDKAQERMLGLASLRLPESQARMAPLVAGLFKHLAKTHLLQGAPEFVPEMGVFQQGGVCVTVGEHLDPDFLALDNQRYTAMVYAPPLNKKGPNGFWLIERGAQHPLSKAFAQAQAWVATEDGQRVSFEEKVYLDGHAAKVLHVYATKASAQASCNAPAGQALLLQGDELLQALALADILVAGSVTALLTAEGTPFAPKAAVRFEDLPSVLNAYCANVTSA